MPGKPRRYDLSEIYLWKKSREDKLAAERRAAQFKSDPDHGWKTARAELIQLRVEQARSRLMAVEDHDQFVERLCAGFRNGLLALAPTLSGHLSGVDELSRLDVIEEHFRDLLGDMTSEHGDDAAPHEGAEPEAEIPGSAEASEEAEAQ